MFNELQPEEFVVMYLTKNSKSSNSMMVIHSDTINYATRNIICVFWKIQMFLIRARSIINSIGFDIDFNNEEYTLVVERKNIYGINYDPVKVLLNKEAYDFIFEQTKRERLSLNTSYGITTGANCTYEILISKFNEKKRIISEYLDKYDEEDKDNEEES
jgi:hypothetical protein